MYLKKKIPKALREQVWVFNFGKVFSAKCFTPWCQNIITVFDFQCGHDVPESKGGPTHLSNLIPICSRCNMSMGNTFTFRQWAEQGTDQKRNNWFSPSCCHNIQCIHPSDTKENGIKSNPKDTSLKVKHLK